MKFTCIDGFSGAGGLSIGLSKAGFDILYSFDIDRTAIETQLLNKKYFNHKIQELDIRDFEPVEKMNELGLTPKGRLSRGKNSNSGSTSVASKLVRGAKG
jgi:DNA (cytosine-5)-methyltransferase 1